MKKYLFFIALFLSLAACRPTKTIQYVTRTDTITLTIRERIRDTVLFSQPDTATFEALMKCDSINRAYLSDINTKPGKRTQIIYRVKNDTIRLTANVDSMAIYHLWRERDTTRNQSTTHTTTAATQPETSPRQWPQWLIIAGLILFLVIIGAIKNLFK